MHSKSNQIVKNNGFQVLQVKYSSSSTVIRHLFIKKFVLSHHRNTNEDKPENQTLFLINLPPFVTEHHVRFLFEKCGKINRVFIQEKPSAASTATLFNKVQSLSENPDYASPIEGFDVPETIMAYKCCYVVFNKSQGLTKALAMADNDSVYSLRPEKGSSEMEGHSEEDFYSGIKLWKKQYNDSIFPPAPTNKKIEEYLEEYRKKKEEEERRQKELEDAGPDEEGWITVNRNFRRNRGALINDQFHDLKIKEKYDDRLSKRRTDEQEFDEQIEPMVKEAVKKKKKKTIEF